MKRILSLVLLMFVLLTYSAIAKTLSQVAAVVNDEMISTYQLDQALAQALANKTDKNQLSAAQFDQLKTNLLEKLINDKLVEQRIAELELSVDGAELDAAIDDVRKKNGLTPDTLKQALEAQGLTMDRYREQIRKEILRYKLLGREVNYKVLVTSSEVRKYFDEHIEKYQVEPKVRISRISYSIPIQASEEDLAALREKLTTTRERLAAGESFDAVMVEQKDNATGGDMGELVEADLAAPLQEAIKGLQPGDVSQPIELNNQLHLFLVTNRITSDTNLFDRVKDEIEEQLKREKTDLRFQEWEHELRANAYVDIRI
ncbi:MAG: SurA N-terminal domain-containing protein [Desulfuromonadales bacterium]|nr:SurA N-terminal domain-containing protein [Desulfuromonadales bacterium]MBN2793330.1 SurA N-terminal domain-containing protein [Desulfuromonadales bacterium]